MVRLLRFLSAPRVMLSLALVQGILYLLLIPPWQHYDEPGHFEYAALLARNTSLTDYGKPDPTLRQTIVDSMVEHNFFWNQPQPPDGWWFHYTELRHPPTYYALISLPLRFVQQRSIETQLFIARSVSLLFFLIAIGSACGVMRELIPHPVTYSSHKEHKEHKDRLARQRDKRYVPVPNVLQSGHMLRVAVPLTMILLPPFADLMTAVNNDVGAIACSCLFLWGSVRTIRRGITWQHTAWVIATALIATAIKSVALFTLIVAPLVFVLALWVQRRWPWSWLLAGISAATIGLFVLTLEKGDAAGWYRWIGAATQTTNTRGSDALAPVGPHIFVLHADSTTRERRLVNPLLLRDVREIAGTTITLGAWMWASEPASIPAPGIALSNRAGEAYHTKTYMVDVTTRPTFIAWTFDVPATTEAVQYVLSITPPPLHSDELTLFLDGAVLARGIYPTDEPPLFNDLSARSGIWGDTPFTNLVRNGSAEQQWLHFRPWVNQSLLHTLDAGWGRTPSLLLAALQDTERSTELLKGYMGFLPMDSLVGHLAWGHIAVGGPWVYLVRGLALVAAVGCLRWFVVSFHVSPGCGTTSLRAALVLLALAGGLVWFSTITRVLPKISEGVVYPFARYTFPAIIPTTLMLVGGWWAVWPCRVRGYAVLVLLCGVAMLNLHAIWTVWMFYL